MPKKRPTASDRTPRVKGERRPAAPGTKRTLPAHLTPGNPGNSGGKKGRSGRHPKAFTAFCRRMTMGAHSQRAIRRIFRKGDQHPLFAFALRWASENGYGKAIQRMDVKGGLTLEQLVGAANTTPATEEDE